MRARASERGSARAGDGGCAHLASTHPIGGPAKVWRYQHWASCSSFEQKRATLASCLKKVHSMASDAEAVFAAGVQKLDEFKRLAYPKSVLRGACTYMAACTACYAWIRVRHVVDTW